MGLELEFTEGMQFDKGYISPYMVTDPERMEAVLEDAYILIHQGKISAVADLLPLLEKVVQAGKPLLDHRRGRRRRGALDAGRQQDPRHCSPRSPSRRPASATAARRCWRTSPCSPAARSSPPRSGSSSTRSASRCSAPPAASSSPRTTPRSIDGGGKRDAVEDRVRQIRAEIENTDSDWDREKLQERLAKLAGGVCVIGVGAATEVELKERKHRIEDAVSATRAAIEEGIVAGGGSALVHAVAVLDDLDAHRRRGDRREHRAPGRRRAAALDRRERRARRATSSSTTSARAASGTGWNGATGEYGDLVAQGVLDPVKVTRSALQNAASIASMVLTTDTLVVEKKEEEPESAGHSHGGHGHATDTDQPADRQHAPGQWPAGVPCLRRAPRRHNLTVPIRRRPAAALGRRSRRHRSPSGWRRSPAGWGSPPARCGPGTGATAWARAGTRRAPGAATRPPTWPG